MPRKGHTEEQIISALKQYQSGATIERSAPNACTDSKTEGT